MTRFVLVLLRARPLALAAVAAIVALGILAWRSLPIDAFPDASNQQVMILTEAPGLSPLDVEQQVTLPIEAVMGGLPRVRVVRSLSKSGLSQVVVVFEDRVGTYFARQLVFERLQAAREQLPPGCEPELGPISTGLGEIFQYTLESDRHDLTELRTLQDWLVAPRLRAIPGVNEVNSFGGMVRQIDVVVDPENLLEFDLALGEIAAALEANNANAGGGFIVKDWEQENLRSIGLFATPEEIGQVVLRAEDGTPVYLSQVADIHPGHVPRLGAVSRDGRGEVVAGMVIMLKDENSQQVVERVKAALPAIERSLPAGVRFNVFYDRTDLIDAVIHTVSSALLQGGLLVMLVLVLAMGTLRTALVTAISLPFTALIAFILMGATGVTANLMSLGGLAIAIGMVVDGSIVVAENGARHLRESRGRPLAPVLAAAVGEVARPVAFSILTIVLVFLPLFTLEGMEGKMFKPLALTMGFAMLASLVAAFAFVPLMMSVLLRPTDRMVEPRLIRFLRERYLRLLARTLDHWRWTLGIAVTALAVVLALAPRIGSEFLPVLDEGAVAVNVVRLPNAALEGSVATADYLERALLELPEVTTVVSKTGRAEISEDPMGPEQTDLVIMLKPHRQWTTGRNKEQLVAAMQERMAAVPGIRPAFSQPIALRVNELVSGLKTDLAVKIFGDDIELLKHQADQVAGVLRGLRGAQDVSVEQVAGFSQLEVVPDRRAMARHQINVADLNEIIETAVGGRVATEMVEGRMRTGVRVRFPAEKRSDPEAIRRILIPSPSGARVPLGEIAELRRIEGPAQISRENGMRRVVVEANIRGRDLGGFVGEARERLAELEAALPPGYWLEYGGTFESQQRAMRRLAVVVPIAIGLILAMLYGALGSFGAAALVLLNVPFALMGGLLAMLIFGIEMNVPAMVGFIALFGTAVQNDTVLVTFIEQLRRQGLDLRQAVLSGCSLRFRALLMTAATTVLGLTPMLYATGSGAEIQRPLAAVVIGGLVTATALTMLVLPTLYARIEGRRALPTS